MAKQTNVEALKELRENVKEALRTGQMHVSPAEGFPVPTGQTRDWAMEKSEQQDREKAAQATT